MLNLVIAHIAEARPFIDHYRLKKSHQHTGFSVFDANKIRLVISGQGKENSACATAYLGGLNNRHEITKSMWVNIGIAGHKTYPVGSLWRVNKVIDESTRKNIYPVRILNLPTLASCSLITVDSPATQYDESSMYDMEASAFFAHAIRFSTSEQIHSLKIISDNQRCPISNFKLSSVYSLIESKMPLISDYLSRLENVLTDDIRGVQNIDIIENNINNLYLTHSQKKIVNDLLNSLSVHKVEFENTIKDNLTAKALIKGLQSKLRNIELTL